MLQTPPLDSIFLGEFEPGLKRNSGEAVAEWARNVAASDNHVVGTMSMMPKEMGGVVDTRLKIHGIQNVRVVGECKVPLLSISLIKALYVQTRLSFQCPLAPIL